RLSAATRFTYGYDSRYLVEVNAGYNGSENFPKGKRYGFFPSVSAGWILSNESFWGDNNPVNSLKIRGSVGKVGNDNLANQDIRFLYLTSMKTQGAQSYHFGDNMRFMPGIEEDQTGNENVTWEVATKTNIGLDLEMFRSKVVLQVDAFW